LLVFYNFDRDDKFKLIHIIAGHNSTLNEIRFYGTEGEFIISSEIEGFIKTTSTENLSNNEISTKIKKNDRPVFLPKIINFDTNYFKFEESSWPTLITCHENSSIVSCWSIKDNCLLDKIIRCSVTKQNEKATCCCLSINTMEISKKKFIKNNYLKT
jgi:hypothetical protein